MPSRVDAHHRDVDRIHHPRFRRQVDGHCELASVRAQVVVLGGRVPRLQREPGTRQKIARAAGRDVGGEDVGFATVGEPMVPETILRALGEMRLDLGFLALLAARCLRLVGLEVGPDPGHECDAPAVGEPAQRHRAGGERRQPHRLAAVRCNEIHLRLVVVFSLGGKSDPLAVRRPLRLGILVAGGQPARLAAVDREKPQLSAAFVLFHVVDRHRGARSAAVRRDCRGPDAFQRPEVLDSQGLFLARHAMVRNRMMRCESAREPNGERRTTRAIVPAHPSGYPLRCGRISASRRFHGATLAS